MGVTQMAADRSRVPLHVVPAGGRWDPSDADLARALMAGEPSAAAMVWNRFAPTVYGIASRALGRDSEAEDITQEVFYRLFSRIGTLQKPEAFRSFVVSFAIRIVKWELRKRRARRWILLSETDRLPEVAVPNGDAESRQVLRRFYAVLDQLTARERLVFALRHLESMTLDEIATALEISLSTTKRTLAKASARVTEWIESDADLTNHFEGTRGD
ncbi:MAG: sigma-70 family RNA polymerase sigma factor, partial [Deltaproteobacteria bacterium]|nr:sigma-70 family RNA polymerase sigma factor [Deltaproteobacteria bacterium]